MHCNLPLWMVLKKMSFFFFYFFFFFHSFIIHALHNRYFDSFWWASFGETTEALMVSCELVSSGGNRATDDDYLIRRVKKKKKNKLESFQTWPAVVCCGLSQRKKGEINNILEVHMFQNSCFQGFFFLCVWVRLCGVSRPLKIFQLLQAPGLWDAMPSF